MALAALSQDVERHRPSSLSKIAHTRFHAETSFERFCEQETTLVEAVVTCLDPGVFDEMVEGRAGILHDLVNCIEPKDSCVAGYAVTMAMERLGMDSVVVITKELEAFKDAVVHFKSGTFRDKHVGFAWHEECGWTLQWEWVFTEEEPLSAPMAEFIALIADTVLLQHRLGAALCGRSVQTRSKMDIALQPAHGDQITQKTCELTMRADTVQNARDLSCLANKVDEKVGSYDGNTCLKTTLHAAISLTAEVTASTFDILPRHVWT